MTELLLIHDLAVVLIVAGAAAWVCRKIGLSAVVGYLVAGAIIGPHTPPFTLVSDLGRVQTLAQLGLIFLIFSAGLSLNLGRLRRMGTSVLFATTIGAILVINSGRLAGWFLGWHGTAGLAFAAMLVSSSSAIISKLLVEDNHEHERYGQLALGVTVLEDVVAILMLTLLTSFSQVGTGNAPSLLATLGGLAAFVVLIVLLVLRFVPGLLAKTKYGTVSEIRTLLLVGLLLGMAWLAERVGYSLALGAFLLGAVLGGTRARPDIERSFEGLYQVFGTVFFVAVGMMVDFRLMLEAWPLTILLVGLALIVRPIACSLGFISVGTPGREAIMAGLYLTPLGEFGFIAAQLGVKTGMLPERIYPAVVGAALITSLVAPVLGRNAVAIQGRIVQAIPEALMRAVNAYHQWLGNLRTMQSRSLVWQVIHRRIMRTVLLMLFVSAILLFASPMYGLLREYMEPGRILPMAFWSGVGVLLLAPLIAVWRHFSALAMIIAEVATSGTSRQRYLQSLLVAGLRVVTALVLGAWLLALLPRSLPKANVVGGVVLFLGVVAALFWRFLVRIQGRAEVELSRRFHDVSTPYTPPSWTDELPDQTGNWDVELSEFELPAGSIHAGETLGGIGFRNQFGCSIVGIDRQGFRIVNPNAKTSIYPGDKLLLLGPGKQISRATQELAKQEGDDTHIGFDELTLEAVLVPPQSPCLGHTLAELELIRLAGVQIGGIRRGGQVLAAPSGADHLEAGDEVLVLGTHAHIREFACRLQPESCVPPPA